MSDVSLGRGTFMFGDCLERMKEIPDGSVDMILCDLPYGTTQNKWDAVIPFELLWREYWRVAKSGAAVVLTAAQPFTSALGASQLAYLRYSLVWDKVRPVGHLMAKRRPMQRHEDVLIFSRETPPYNPQGLVCSGKINRRTTSGNNYNSAGLENVAEFTNYPQSILTFPPERDGQHPTQKPAPLFEYMIRTYTDEGMTVLDNCAGSGTTAIAAERTKRNWICIERDPDYFVKAVARVKAEVDLQKQDLFA